MHNQIFIVEHSSYISPRTFIHSATPAFYVSHIARPFMSAFARVFYVFLPVFYVFPAVFYVCYPVFYVFLTVFYVFLRVFYVCLPIPPRVLQRPALGLV